MANPFERKEWQRRLVQYPTRRTLTDTVSGDVQTVDFARAEGQIYQQGDGFTDQNMNNLEQRIYDAFNNVGSDMSHTVPRVVPKDITQYYNDGTLWYRLHGTHGFEVLEDIYVGDYFRLTTGPITCKNLSQNADIAGASYVLIADIIIGSTNILLLLPAYIGSGGLVQASNFGHTYVASSLQEFKDHGMNEFFYDVMGMGSDPASDTLVSKLQVEFGTHLGFSTSGTVLYPNGFDNNYEATGFERHSLPIALLDESNMIGYPTRSDLHSPLSNQAYSYKYNLYPNGRGLSFFRHGGTIYADNTYGFTLLGLPLEKTFMRGYNDSITIDSMSSLFGNSESWKYLAICTVIAVY